MIFTINLVINVHVAVYLCYTVNVGYAFREYLAQDGSAKYL